MARCYQDETPIWTGFCSDSDASRQGLCIALFSRHSPRLFEA